MNQEQELVLSLLDKYINDNEFIKKVVDKCWRNDENSMTQGDPPWVDSSVDLDIFYSSEFVAGEVLNILHGDDEQTCYLVGRVPIREGCLTGELHIGKECHNFVVSAGGTFMFSKSESNVYNWLDSATINWTIGAITLFWNDKPDEVKLVVNYEFTKLTSRG